MILLEVGLLGLLEGRLSRRLTLILGFLAALSSADGATFTVTTVADSGPGSLRQAILDANANPGADQIHFNISGTGPLPSPHGPPGSHRSRRYRWHDPGGLVGCANHRFNGANAGVDPGIRLATTQCTIRGLSSTASDSMEFSSTGEVPI